MSQQEIEEVIKKSSHNWLFSFEICKNVECTKENARNSLKGMREHNLIDFIFINRNNFNNVVKKIKRDITMNDILPHQFCRGFYAYKCKN